MLGIRERAAIQFFHASSALIDLKKWLFSSSYRCVMIIDRSILSHSRGLAWVRRWPRGQTPRGHVEGAWTPQFEAFEGVTLQQAAVIDGRKDPIRSWEWGRTLVSWLGGKTRIRRDLWQPTEIWTGKRLSYQTVNASSPSNIEKKKPSFRLAMEREFFWGRAKEKKSLSQIVVESIFVGSHLISLTRVNWVV
jgi:hypothetical protein